MFIFLEKKPTHLTSFWVLKTVLSVESYYLQ